MPPLFLSSALLSGVCTVVWVLSRNLEEDRHSQFRLAADQTAAGDGGRILGRWVGALLVSVLSMAVILLLLHLSSRGAAQPTPAQDTQGLYYMHDTNTGVRGWGMALAVLASCGAWALAIARWLHPAMGVIGGLSAWTASHVPWESPTVLGGVLGGLVRCLFPTLGGGEGAPVALAGGYVLATAGLLCLALAAREDS